MSLLYCDEAWYGRLTDTEAVRHSRAPRRRVMETNRTPPPEAPRAEPAICGVDADRLLRSAVVSGENQRLQAVSFSENVAPTMAPALMGAGMNAERARLFQELTHGLNANIVVWEGGQWFWRGETDLQPVLSTLLGK